MHHLNKKNTKFKDKAEKGGAPDRHEALRERGRMLGLHIFSHILRDGSNGAARS